MRYKNVTEVSNAADICKGEGDGDVLKNLTNIEKNGVNKVFKNVPRSLPYAMNGKSVVLLLIGGDKSTQHKDIETAKAYWKRQREE